VKGNEVDTSEWLVEFWYQERGLSDVEWEYGMNSMRHVKRGEARVLPNGDTIHPKHMRSDSWPVRNVTMAGLYYRV
jgi:hypothetical protein